MDSEDIISTAQATSEAATASTTPLDASFFYGGLISSFILLAGLLALRIIIIRLIRGKDDILSDEKRGWVVATKNAFFVAGAVGLFLIWAPQIHAFTISVAAFAVAFVVATKEWILCLLGGLMRASTKPFEAGDWVTVDGITGEVVDFNAFAFRIEEIDTTIRSYRYTGRSVTVPNAFFFTQKIVNANFLKKFVFHDVSVTLQYADLDPKDILEKLAELADAAYAPHRNTAKALKRKVERKAGIYLGELEPHITLKTSDVGHQIYGLRLFLPTTEAVSIGSALTADILSHARDLRTAQKKEAG